MSKFEVGTKVIATISDRDDCCTVKGTIIKVFEAIAYAVVDTESGDIIKVKFKDLELDPGETDQTEKNGIVIDQCEFQKLAYEIGIEEANGDLNLVYRFGKFAGKLQEAIFSDRY